MFLPQWQFTAALLTALLALGLMTIVAYFFWFVKRTSVDGLLQRISRQTRQWFKQINEKEAALKEKYDQFLEKVGQASNDLKFDTSGSLATAIVYVGNPHYTLVTDREGVVEGVDLQGIKSRLSDVLQSGKVEALIEVEPGCPIPEKDLKKGVRNYNLLTLSLKSQANTIFDKADFLKSMKRLQEVPAEVLSFMKTVEPLLEMQPEGLSVMSQDQKDQVDRAIGEILAFYGCQLDSCFPIDQKYAITNVERLALADYRQMAQYAIIKQADIDIFLDYLDEILTNQLYGINEDVFLGLKRRESHEMSECVMEIIPACLKTGNTEGFRRILSRFHELVVQKFAGIKNPDCMKDLFSILEFTNRYYMKHLREFFCGPIAVLPLHIAEFVRFGFLRQFKAETSEEEIHRYFLPVLKEAIDSCHWMILETLKAFSYGSHPYGHLHLNEQLRHFIRILEFYPKYEADCFARYQDYEQMTREKGYKERPDFKVMISKLGITDSMREHLTKSILELLIYALYFCEKRLLRPEVIRFYVLPAVRVIKNGFEKFVRAAVHDSHWEDDVQMQLEIGYEISPPGPYELRPYNLKKLWVVLAIYTNITEGQFFTPRHFASDTEVTEFKSTLDVFRKTLSVWASVLGIGNQELTHHLGQLDAKLQGIKVKAQKG